MNNKDLDTLSKIDESAFIEDRNRLFSKLSDSPIHKKSICVQNDISMGNDWVPLHSHVFYEILFINSGNINYLLDNYRFNIQPGDILIIPPGIAHQPIFPEKFTQPYDRYVVWMSQEFLEFYSEDTPEIKHVFKHCEESGIYLLRFETSLYRFLFTLVQSILKEQSTNKFGSRSQSIYTLLLLLTHLGKNTHNQKAELSPENAAFDQIYAYITSHYNEKITLDSVAKDLYISKSYITHQFRSVMGISFHQCVTQRRLNQVKNNILIGIPLQTAWQNCGFTDYTVFFKAFKKEFGVSPREFVKRWTA